MTWPLDKKRLFTTKRRRGLQQGIVVTPALLTALHLDNNPNHKVELIDGDFLDLRDDLAAGASSRMAAGPAITPPAATPRVRQREMITAYGDEDTKRQAMAQGATGLLTKPIDFALLRQEIDARLDQAA
jgi:hypothetical protein